MATVKGQNLRIFVDGRSIGAALDCQLQLQLNVTPYSTKDDEGAWTKNRVVSLQWSVTANAVVTDIDYVEALGITDLADLIGETVQVQLNTTGGEMNRESTGQLLAGDAIISDVQYTAQNRQRTTCQVTLTGRRTPSSTCARSSPPTATTSARQTVTSSLPLTNHKQQDNEHRIYIWNAQPPRDDSQQGAAIRAAVW